LGLHVVLTDGRPLTQAKQLAPSGNLPSAQKLGRMALLHCLPKQELVAEVSAQFEEFARVLGRPPRFVDGHQHTHVLPGVRDIVLGKVSERAPAAWVRSCKDRTSSILRRPFRLKALANSMQSAGLGRAASEAGIGYNDSFSGLYDFRSSYAQIFPRFLSNPGHFHLVICHPGEAGTSGDTIGPAREREASALRLMPVPELAAVHGLSFE
jgi:predicted glycoside hydrolase/deacetylase ChbG (UPF0249 family)